MEEVTYDALIIGAGPVGLALATELTMRGHKVFVAEKNERVGVQPRAKTTNVRSMTQMRRWGLADTIRARSPLPEGFKRRVRFTTGLFGHDIYYFDNPFCADPVRDDRFPEHAEFIPQYVVEGVLHEHVKAHPLADLTMQQELVAFAQDGDGVTATLRDVNSDKEHQIRARFMVGADGGRSTVRKQLGIEMRGQRDMISFVTLIMRIHGLNDDPDLEDALFHWIVDPDAPGLAGPMDKGDKWYWTKALAKGETVSIEDMLDLVRANMGKDYQIEVLTRDDWTVHGVVADRYREGRVFLAGDACHLHSPFGGHGMNQGVGDAVDLGWKLSAALQGWGGKNLLDSYQFERRQMHENVLKTASENVASLSDQFANPKLMLDGEEGDAARRVCALEIEEAKKPEFRSLGLVIGYRYTDSPINAEESGAAPKLDVTTYTPLARPGHLAPHAWLDDGRSLYDIFDQGFTLLRLGEASDALETKIADAASAVGVPIALKDVSGANLRNLYEADYALIRPDQHVAWRGDSVGDASELIDRVRGA